MPAPFWILSIKLTGGHIIRSNCILPFFTVIWNLLIVFIFIRIIIRNRFINILNKRKNGWNLNICCSILFDITEICISNFIVGKILHCCSVLQHFTAVTDHDIIAPAVFILARFIILCTFEIFCLQINLKNRHFTGYKITGTWAVCYSSILLIVITSPCIYKMIYMTPCCILMTHCRDNKCSIAYLTVF